LFHFNHPGTLYSLYKFIQKLPFTGQLSTKAHRHFDSFSFFFVANSPWVYLDNPILQ